MSRRALWPLVLLWGCAPVSLAHRGPGPGPRTAADRQVARLGQSYVHDTLSADPVRGSALGLRRYDHALPEPSSSTQAARRRVQRRYARALSSIDPGGLSASFAIDRALLVHAVDGTLADLRSPARGSVSRAVVELCEAVRTASATEDLRRRVEGLPRLIDRVFTDLDQAKPADLRYTQRHLLDALRGLPDRWGARLTADAASQRTGDAVRQLVERLDAARPSPRPSPARGRREHWQARLTQRIGGPVDVEALLRDARRRLPRPDEAEAAPSQASEPHARVPRTDDLPELLSVMNRPLPAAARCWAVVGADGAAIQPPVSTRRRPPSAPPALERGGCPPPGPSWPRRVLSSATTLKALALLAFTRSSTTSRTHPYRQLAAAAVLDFELHASGTSSTARADVQGLARAVTDSAARGRALVDHVERHPTQAAAVFEALGRLRALSAGSDGDLLQSILTQGPLPVVLLEQALRPVHPKADDDDVNLD